LLALVLLCVKSLRLVPIGGLTLGTEPRRVNGSFLGAPSVPVAVSPSHDVRPGFTTVYPARELPNLETAG